MHLRCSPLVNMFGMIQIYCVSNDPIFKLLGELWVTTPGRAFGTELLSISGHHHALTLGRLQQREFIYSDSEFALQRNVLFSK